jgi:hypothetical protein
MMFYGIKLSLEMFDTTNHEKLGGGGFQGQLWRNGWRLKEILEAL